MSTVLLALVAAGVNGPGPAVGRGGRRGGTLGWLADRAQLMSCYNLFLFWDEDFAKDTIPRGPQLKVGHHVGADVDQYLVTVDVIAHLVKPFNDCDPPSLFSQLGSVEDVWVALIRRRRSCWLPGRATERRIRLRGQFGVADRTAALIV